MSDRIQITRESRWQDPSCLTDDHWVVRHDRLKSCANGRELDSNHSMEWFDEQVKSGKLVPCDENGRIIPKGVVSTDAQ